MEIQAGPNDWAVNDEDNWGSFLNTETGRRFYIRLLEGVPQLLPGGDTNAVLIRAGEVRGFQLAVQEMARMAQHQQAAAQTSQGDYPPLENDAAWNDGKKLEPETARPVLEPNFAKP